MKQISAIFILWLQLLLVNYVSAQKGAPCRFRGERTGEKVVRLSEATPIGTEAFRVLAFPRRNFNIQALDGSRELNGYFSFRELDRSRVGIVLEKSLQDLVDQSAPTSSIQFRLACRGISGETDYLPVTVLIEDINDHHPQFVGAPYRIRVEELTPPGLTVFRGLQALDRDKPNTANSEVTYSIIGGNEQRKFSVEATSSKKAVIVLRKDLDYDSGDKLFNLTIRAEDNGSPPLASETFIVIDIRDGDDLNPTFTQALYTTQIQEDYPITGKPVEKQLKFNPPITAYDQDLGINASLTFSILSGNELGFFSIDPATGRLFAISEVDRESLENGDDFLLEIEVQQMDNPLKAATAKVKIHVEDINDNKPQFEITEMKKSILEHVADGKEIATFHATDPDISDNARFLYSLNDPSGAFEINPHTGSLTMKDGAKFDREKFKNGFVDLVIGTLELKPSVLPLNQDQAQKTAVKVRIEVKDDNDNSPVFLPTNTYSFTVDTSELALGLVIGQVQATDADSDNNGLVRYRIRTSDAQNNLNAPFHFFGIDAATGHIRIKKFPLTKRKYNLYVYGIDQAKVVDKRRSSMAIVQIKLTGQLNQQQTGQQITSESKEEEVEIIKAVSQKSTPTETRVRLVVGSDAIRERPRKTSSNTNSQNAPNFPPGVQKFEVASDARPGTPIGRPRVFGLSSNGSAVQWNMKHRYRHGVPFDISLHSGLINLVKPIGKHALDAYTVKVSVNSEGKSDSTRVRIQIVDPAEAEDLVQGEATEKSKQVEQLREEFERTNFAFKAKENSPGVLVANLTLLEFQSRGDPTFFEYVITSEDSKEKFTITDNGLLYTKVGLDREVQDEYEITIAMARRGTIRSKEVLQVRVKVLDENDNSPSFDKHIYQGSIKEDAEPGTKVQLDHNITVTDPDEDDESRLQLLGKGSTLFQLNPDTKEITLRLIGNSTKNVMGLSERAEDKKLYLRLRATDKAGHITESQLVVRIITTEKKKKEHEEIVVRGLSIIDGQNVKLIENGGKGDLLVKETAPVGTKIAQLVITDQTSQQLEKELKFEIVEETTNIQPNLFRLPKRQIAKSSNNNPDTHFQMDENTGYLSLTRKLNVRHKYTLKIKVTDESGLTAQTSIEASVEDVNDHPPVFAKTSYEFRISEGTYDKVKIGEILASDGDVGINAEVRYEISTPKMNVIKLDRKDGSLYVDGNLDRESTSEMTFEIIAKDRATSRNDKGEQVHSAKVNITLFILDINDNAPTFYGYTRLRRKEEQRQPGVDMLSNIVPIYLTEVISTLPAESEFFRVSANDSDVGLNGLVTFELLNHRDTFRVDAFTGSLFTLKKLNFEAQNQYDLSIVASDRGRPSLRSMAAVMVTVKQIQPAILPKQAETVKANPFVDTIQDKEEVREQIPTITAKGKLFSDPEIVIEVLENIRTPANILDLKSVMSKDAREIQGDVSFEIIGSNLGVFRIDQRSGYLQLTESPNREQRETYVLTLKAYLKPPSSEREVPVFFYTLYVQETNAKKIAEDDLIVHINIMDLNDNSPEFLTFENPVQTSVSSHLEAGALIAKMEAWDADKDLNAKIRYSLIHQKPESTQHLLRIHATTGDVTLLAPLLNLPGHTLTVTVEARDLEGAQNGLSAQVDLVVYVLDNGFQLKMVLDNNVDSVMKDVGNITETLSALTGLSVKAYEVDEHKSIFEETKNKKAATDLLIFAVDEFNNLITSAKFIRSLTNRLPEAKARLAYHRLREVRAGGHTLSPDTVAGSSSPNNSNDSDDSLGSLEIAVLGMACAVFFGAFIAVISIFGIRARRQAKNGYPAPLAIPLPSYSVDPNNNAGHGGGGHGHHPPGPPIGILHHGDITRQSIKSASKFRPSMERSLMKTIDTSEETSDTCVDEHHDVSSGPPSGPVEFFHVGHQAFVATAAGVTPKPNRRSRSNHSPSKSPSWRRPNQSQRLPQIEIPDIKTLERTARSRDSGINDQRESLSLSCSCNNDTSCGSCSDHSDEHNMNRTNPQRHSTTSSQFRRHKSASPSRRKSVPPPNQCGCHHNTNHQHHHHHHGDGHMTLHRHHHHVQHMSATLRSKSTGQLVDEDHHIRGSTRSRSRSKSKLDCTECCSTDQVESNRLARGDRSTQSTRSTRWEVYRHVDSPKKGLNSSQRRKSPIYKAELQGSESPETLRIASSTANKAHSWRGDHPMKSGAGYFQSNPSLQPPNPNNPNTNNTGSYYAHQGSKTFNPYHAGKPSYEFGQKQTNFLQSAQSGGKVIHNGIRLVGLANSPNDSK